jgi:hypothetical protein
VRRTTGTGNRRTGKQDFSTRAGQKRGSATYQEIPSPDVQAQAWPVGLVDGTQSSRAVVMTEINPPTPEQMRFLRQQHLDPLLHQLEVVHVSSGWWHVIPLRNYLGASSIPRWKHPLRHHWEPDAACSDDVCACASSSCHWFNPSVAHQSLCSLQVVFPATGGPHGLDMG